MKAAVLHANQDIRYEEWPTPEVTPGTVLVKVRATGICGSDIPRVNAKAAHFYPIVLGHEFSGDVVEVGQGVTSVKAGMRVAGVPLIPCFACEDCIKGDYALCSHYRFVGSREQGSFGEYVLLPERNVVPFADNVTYVQGAMIEPSTVTLHGLFQSDFRCGGNTLILGGGTIGQFTAQWARIMGSRTVTLLDIVDSRLALALALGADYAFNSLDPQLQQKLREVTNGKGFDNVFETAGATVTMRMAFTLAATKANVCFIGTPHTDLTYSPAVWENMNRKEFNLTGSWLSYSAPFPGKEWELTAHEMATGRLRFDERLVHCAMPLKDADKAFEMYRTPGLVQGKIILIP